MNWSELIGKKIVAFRGFTRKHLEYILFDDKETFIELTEQDYYSYHDCSQSARHLDLRKNAKTWERLFNKEGFDEPTNLGHPF